MITVKFTESLKSNWDALELTIIPLLRTKNYSIQQVYSNSYALFVVRVGDGNGSLDALLVAIENIPGILRAYITPYRDIKQPLDH